MLITPFLVYYILVRAVCVLLNRATDVGAACLEASPNSEVLTDRRARGGWRLTIHQLNDRLIPDSFLKADTKMQIST